MLANTMRLNISALIEHVGAMPADDGRLRYLEQTAGSEWVAIDRDWTSHDRPPHSGISYQVTPRSDTKLCSDFGVEPLRPVSYLNLVPLRDLQAIEHDIPAISRSADASVEITLGELKNRLYPEDWRDLVQRVLMEAGRNASRPKQPETDEAIPKTSKQGMDSLLPPLNDVASNTDPATNETGPNSLVTRDGVDGDEPIALTSESSLADDAARPRPNEPVAEPNPQIVAEPAAPQNDVAAGSPDLDPRLQQEGLPRAAESTLAAPRMTVARRIVPLNRLPELMLEIKHSEELRKQYREQVLILREQIAKQGGFESADTQKIQKLKTVSEALHTTERGIRALEFEARLQSDLNRAVSYWVLYRDASAVALQRIPDLAETLAFMPLDVRNQFGSGSAFACFDLSYLASLYHTAAEIQREIAELEQIRSDLPEEFADSLQLIELRFQALQDVWLAELGTETPEPLGIIESKQSRLRQLIPDSPHVDYRTGAKDFLRVTNYPVTTNSPSGDLLSLFEIYPPGTLSRLRLFITYDLPWYALPVNLTSDPGLNRALRHLGKLCGALCRKSNGVPTSPYRFPNSISFLRLYDEMVVTQDQVSTADSLYIPCCHVSEFIRECKGDKSLAASSEWLRSLSIPAPVLAELFPRMMLGSCWLEESELRMVHSVIVELIRGGVKSRIGQVVHFQLYSEEAQTQTNAS